MLDIDEILAEREFWNEVEILSTPRIAKNSNQSRREKWINSTVKQSLGGSITRVYNTQSRGR